MKIKHILLDIDGVLIEREKYFSERLAQEQEIDLNLVTPFFKNEFRFCVTGNADLKDELLKYIEVWGWLGSIDDLLLYWFSSESKLNKKLLEIIDKVRESVNVSLVSDQEKYRAEYLLDDLDLAKHSDEAFFSCDLGVTKNEKAFFEKVLLALNAKPQEVIYFDDDPKNIEVAQDLGINAKLYRDIDSVKEGLKDLL